MGVSTKQLQDERTVLQKTFDELNVKIKTVENETQKMRNNLNAVHGAIQEIDKLIKLDQITGAQMRTAGTASCRGERMLGHKSSA